MTKKITKILIVLILVLTAYFLLFKIIRVQDKILKSIYPMKYSEYVEKYSDENGIDVYMVFAIIKVESNFNTNVKSGSNAIGLMQLLEGTAIERSKIIYKEDIKEEDLYNPETNIKLGTSYYAYLLDYYKQNNILALTAYNAGIGNVDSWIKAGIIKADGTDLENIPYKETNNYVRKILRDYEIYKNVYEESN